MANYKSLTTQEVADINQATVIGKLESLSYTLNVAPISTSVVTGAVNISTLNAALASQDAVVGKAIDGLAIINVPVS